MGSREDVIISRPRPAHAPGIVEVWAAAFEFEHDRMCERHRCKSRGTVSVERRARAARSWSARLESEQQDDIVLVAFESDAVLGYVVAGDPGWVVGLNSGDAIGAEVKELAVVPERHKQGIGRRLLREVARALAQRDHSSLFGWVWDCSPAESFYAHLGAQQIQSREWSCDQDTVQLQTAYAWRDSSALLG